MSHDLRQGEGVNAEMTLPPDLLLGWEPFAPCVICGKPSERWEDSQRIPMVPCKTCRGQFCHLHRLTHLCMVKDVPLGLKGPPPVLPEPK